MNSKIPNFLLFLVFALQTLIVIRRVTDARLALEVFALEAILVLAVTYLAMV